jgi:O-antigen/teichoic acid export membrane protein
MLSDRILSPGGISLFSILAFAGLLLLLVVLRLARPGSIEPSDAARRILKNSSLPIGSQFFVRGIDLLVALAVLRLLGPSRNGEYALAVIIWFYVKTLSDFGLGLYTTREISRHPKQSGSLTGGTALFRLLALAAAALPVALYLGVRWSFGNVSNQLIATVVILVITIVPGSISEAINSALNGVERMDIAAGINVSVNLVRAPLAVVLAATSLGIVGIAFAALAGALVSVTAFLVAYRRIGLSQIIFRLDLTAFRLYARESAPLLVNALLLSLFFRFDIFIVEALRGSESLGLYDAAFKPINLLTIIPAYATLAVFPLMARSAADPASLARAHRVTAYLLVTLAWAIVVVTFALARPAIQILAGDAFLPESATLLRVLIFFAPLSFLNGVFQYVLIAQGRQRDIVPAFAAAVVFNICGNLALVPIFGTIAAAVLTVLTEVVIFFAFVVLSRGRPVMIHERSSMARLSRPSLAGIIAIAATLPFLERPLLAAAVGVGVFVGLSLAFGVVGTEEREIGRKLLSRSQPPASV